MLPLLVAPSSMAACDPTAAVVFVDRGQSIRLQKWGQDSIRVTALRGSAEAPPPSYPSALLPTTVVPCPARTSSNRSMTNGNLRATVGMDGLLRFVRVSDSFELLRERYPRNFTGDALDLSFQAYDNEVLYGLGQHKTGKLQNKGQRFITQPINTEILIPIVHSNRDYSYLWDMPSFGFVSMSNSSTHWHSENTPYLSLWVTTTSAATTRAEAPGWSERVSKYVNATGHAPRMPKWTSGYWQSRNRYRNQSEVMAVANGYKALGLPLALLIIDYHTW